MMPFNERERWKRPPRKPNWIGWGRPRPPPLWGNTFQTARTERPESAAQEIRREREDPMYAEPENGDGPCTLGDPMAFSDEPAPADYFDRWPGHDPERTGPKSSAVTRRLLSSCAGWRTKPTAQEFYEAVHAEEPTERQKLLIRMWAVEASELDMLDAWAEEVYTWRSLVRALHRAGPLGTDKLFRELNQCATVPRYGGVRLWTH